MREKGKRTLRIIGGMQSRFYTQPYAVVVDQFADDAVTGCNPRREGW